MCFPTATITRVLWLSTLLLPILGCRGCDSQRANTNESQGDKGKNQKQRLVADELRTLPYSAEIVGNSIKPGHWYQTRHKLKANFGDEALVASLFEIDRDENPIPPWTQGIPMQFERNLSLAKGRRRPLSSRCYSLRIFASRIPPALPIQTPRSLPVMRCDRSVPHCLRNLFCSSPCHPTNTTCWS